MPEELNRLVTDVLSDVLWTPSPEGDANLQAEGIDAEKISRVGNIMLDSFEMVRPQIEAAGVAAELGLGGARYGVVTLHRPSNVDDPAQLEQLVSALVDVQSELQLVFPVHPRTAARLEAAGMTSRLTDAGVLLIEPVPYIRFMSLVVGASAVITDSGGVQEETTYLGIPCLTLRENTERPITIEQGTNRLSRSPTLLADLRDSLARPRTDAARPEFWDGQTARRCVEDLRRRSR
jgi:UDP-N-acetylglucosamine 2-epimerase (non-hydrolysing)